MGADIEGTVGGEEDGDGGDAGDDKAVEGERAWEGVEEVAEMRGGFSWLGEVYWRFLVGLWAFYGFLSQMLGSMHGLVGRWEGNVRWKLCKRWMAVGSDVLVHTTMTWKKTRARNERAFRWP